MNAMNTQDIGFSQRRTRTNAVCRSQDDFFDRILCSTTGKEEELLLRFLVAWLEVVWCLLQFISLNYILQQPRQRFFPKMSSTWSAAASAVESCLVLSFMCYQYSKKIGLPFQTFLMRLASFKLWPTRSFVLLMYYMLASFGFCCLLQYMVGRWYFSMENYTVTLPNSTLLGEWDKLRILEILLLAPFKEEIIFRVLLYHIIYRRTNKVVASIIFTNTVFGLLHLSNISSQNYTPLYVALQVMLGTIVGMFYSTRLLAAQSTWEPLLLHISNNFFGSFMATDDLRVTDPVILFSLIQTGLVYGALTFKAFESKGISTPSLFSVPKSVD